MGRKSRAKKERAPKKGKTFTDFQILEGVIREKDFNFVGAVNKGTIHALLKLWKDNAENNFSSDLWNKHANVLDPSFLGMGKDKCVIGVGAGQSFNINKHVLARAINLDGMRDWNDRHYITIASNHQYKPLLNMGIIPDFVLAVDGSDVIYDQLCTDIPSIGQNTIFIAGMHCSHKVLKEWSDQGRQIIFYLNASEDMRKMFQAGIKDDPKKYVMEMGGNVLNGAWALSGLRMGSTVFIAVGNDLSFKVDEENVDNQRNNYYADGDYSTNAKDTGTGRDEAGKEKPKMWGGFKISRRLIYPGQKDRYNIELDPVGTSHTLWVYKTWLESTIMRMMEFVDKTTFHYYNCSEAGILGVMSKVEDNDKRFQEAMRDINNWFMLDEKCKFYSTYILEDAIELFDKAKELYECHKNASGMPLIARPAGAMAALH